MDIKRHLIALFILLSNILNAQVSGIVVDDSNNIPIEYATVAIYRSSDDYLISGVVTNTDGSFEFDNINNGNYKIEVSFIGYTTEIIEHIEVNNSQKNVELGIIALSLGDELDEIEIKSTQATLVNKIDRQVFNADNFENTKGGSATEIIQNLPSVTIDALGEISLRGSNGLTVLINGKPTQGDATSILAQIPANAIESVEVITAPSAKYDPDGKGGIINIITKKGAIDGTFAQVNLRGGFPSIEPYGNQELPHRYGIDATINKRTDKWNFSLGASYQRNDKNGRRVGDVYTINQPENKQTFLPSDGERSFDDLSYNGRFTIDYTPNSSNEFSVGFFAGKRTKDRLADIYYYDNHAVSPIGSSNRLYTFSYYNHNLRTRKGDFILGNFDYTHTFLNESKLATSFLYEYSFLGGPTENDNVDSPEYNIIYQQEYNTNDNPLHGIRFNLDYTLKPSAIGKFTIGYQYRDLNHKGEFIYERDDILIPMFSSEIELNRTIHSSYGQLTGSKNKWDYAAGIRLESMDREYEEALLSDSAPNVYEYSYLKLFPSASLQYEINEQTKLKTSYSKRVERTTTFKMNSFVEREHSEVFEQGDNRLKPEFIDLVELGLEKKINKTSVNATAYFRHVDNVIDRVNTLAYETTGAIIDTVLNRVYSNVGKSNTIGLEVSTEFKATDKWKNYIGANVYNYDIQGEFVFRHRDGIERTYDVSSNSTIYSINLNSTYSFWKNATAQFTFNYLSDINTAQGSNSRFYNPNITLKKLFFDDNLAATLQWQNIDMGLLNSNEQSIATWRSGEFYTYTNYIYEVDIVTLTLTYTFNKAKNKAKFTGSEFGKNEF